MAKTKMIQEIVKVRFSLYDNDLQGLIAKSYALHKRSADVDERMIDVIWEDPRCGFHALNVEASRDDEEASEAAKRGELTLPGRTAILAYIDNAQAYAEGLLELSDAELIARYDETCGPDQAVRQAKRREKGLRADVLAFFSKGNAKADYSYWLNLPTWSAEEATALSFSKDPRRVNVASLGEYTCVHGSPFRDDFMARLDLIERAVRGGNLKVNFTPVAFSEWAAKRKIEIPADLTLQRGKNRDGIDDTPIHGNRLHKMYTIILGMAVKHYQLDLTLPPADSQSDVYESIMKDLINVSAEVHEETLSAIVQQALIWAHDAQPPVMKTAQRKKDQREQAGMRVPGAK